MTLPHFLRFFLARCGHNRRVAISIGAFLNAIGILLGAFFGLALRKPIALRAQLYFRNAIGAFTIFFALRLIYISLEGSFLSRVKQVFIALLAVILGFWVGKLFRFQKISNRLGRMAQNAIVAAQRRSAVSAADAFNACAILFCAAPLGIIGAVADGSANYFYLLAVKGIMDGLAMMGFIRIFRWPAAMSAVPVFVFFSAISLAVQLYARPFLGGRGMDSVNIAAGILACIITVVIFEVRKVELANYLPALVLAPALARLFG